MNIYIESKQEEFTKVIEFFKKEISTLRTGRANPNILDGVHVEAYGVKTPLNGVASIGVADGQSILITPWDKNILKDVEKAIIAADLGFGVINEGDKVRLTVPQMTEENRLEIVKKLNEKQEAARVAVRKTREDIKSDIEQAEDNKEITEDDKFRFIKELDEETVKKNEEIKELRDNKEADIMTI